MSDSAWAGDGPSIDEMRDMLRRPVGVDFYPPVRKPRRCEKCHATHAEWWLVLNGRQYCNRCA